MDPIQIDVSTDNSFLQQQTQKVQRPSSAQPLSPAASVQAQKISSPASVPNDTVELSATLQDIMNKTAEFFDDSPNSQAAANLSLTCGSFIIVKQSDQTYSGILYPNSGGKITISLNQNIRIQENDDGSASIFFETDNITRQYSAGGTVLEFQGNILKQNKKSIIVNNAGGTVEAENCTAVALADGTVINATGGNTIILKNNINNVEINAANGSNAIKGQNIGNSSINLGGGKNTVKLLKASGIQISSANGNAEIKIAELTDSTVLLAGGTHKVNILSASNNAISLTSKSPDRESDISVFGTAESNTVSLYGEKVNLFINKSGQNTVSSSARWTNAKFSESENDAVSFKTYWASLSAGSVINGAYSAGSSQSFSLNANLISGNSNITAESLNASVLTAEITDGSKLTVFGKHFAAARINTVSANAQIDIDSLYCTNVQIGKMLENALINITGQQNLVSAAGMEDNSSLNLKKGRSDAAIGSISDSAAVSLENGNANVIVAQNTSAKELPSPFKNFSLLSAAEKNKAYSDFMRSAADSPAGTVTVPQQFRIKMVL